MEIKIEKSTKLIREEVGEEVGKRFMQTQMLSTCLKKWKNISISRDTKAMINSKHILTSSNVHILNYNQLNSICVYSNWKQVNTRKQLILYLPPA